MPTTKELLECSGSLCQVRAEKIEALEKTIRLLKSENHGLRASEQEAHDAVTKLDNVNTKLLQEKEAYKIIAKLEPEKKKFKRGTQIVYMPAFANNDSDHPAVEEGFITSNAIDTVFCRYWNKHSPNELRTKYNSERTQIENIQIKDTRPQSDIVRELEIIDHAYENRP